MLHIYDRAGMNAVSGLDLDPRLKRLLVDRISGLTDELKDYTEYLVVQPNDAEDDIVRHIGLSPLIEPIGGARFGGRAFHPFWDYLAAHDGWFEMIVTFGSAFGYVLMIADADGVDEELLRLCRKFTRNP